MDMVLPALNEHRSSSAAPTRIRLTYLWRHRKLPDLSDPQTFTEWVQWRKLNDRDARLPLFADKVRVKDLVADRIGAEWIIPTIWHGEELPANPDWPTPLVVKSRHGCNQYAFVFEQQADWGPLRRQTKEWMKGWDGTLKGKPAASGTYVWMIKGIDTNGSVVEMKGTVILIR